MKNPIIYIAGLSLVMGFTACGNRAAEEKQPEQTAIPPTQDSVQQITGANPPAVSTEEQEAGTFFASFRELSNGSHDSELKELVHFPLYTAAEKIEVKKKDFNKVFNPDMQRKIAASDGNVTKVEENLPAGYRETIDSGTALYQMQVQDTAFILGKVKGKYMIVGVR